jgi:tetratricopeptide (TPR) repeat protein
MLVSRYARVGAVLVALLLVSQGAEAAPTARDKRIARQEYQRGKRAFDKKAYGKALEHYRRAYQRLPLSGLLFNIAQCHRNLGNKREAAHFFRLYLSKQPNARNRGAVESLLRNLQSDLEKQRLAEKRAAERRAAEQRAEQRAAEQRAAEQRAAEQRAAERRDAERRAAGKQPTSQQVRADLIKTPPPKRPSRPFYKRWWFWTGVAAVVGGGVAGVYLATRSTGDDFPDTHLPVANVDK